MDMCKETITELARATISKVNPTVYGRMRTKLNKQGFSEIAIYTEIAKHCIDNGIDPASMGKETMEYLEGCALNAFHPKMSNEFPELRGKFHQLRHGDTDKGEPKSAEQKGNFLCNKCFEIKSDKLRARNKNERNMCAACKSQRDRDYQKGRANERKDPKITSDKPAQPISLSTSKSGFKHEETSQQLSEALNSLPEPEVKREEPPLWHAPKPESKPEPVVEESAMEEPVIEEPVIEEQTETPEMTEQTEQVQTEAKPEEKKFGDQIKITEVMADSDSATISLQCPTESLHLVLAAIKDL